MDITNFLNKFWVYKMFAGQPEFANYTKPAEESAEEDPSSENTPDSENTENTPDGEDTENPTE